MGTEPNTIEGLSPIVITVTPDQRPGRCRAHIGTEPMPLCVSRQPFLDGARKLIAKGHNSGTMLAMRWAGAKDWALRGSLGAAANLTVDEHNGTFAEWKPYSRSAVPPGNANSARKVPKGRIAEKAIPESTAEKAGERTELDSIHHQAPQAEVVMIMGVDLYLNNVWKPWLANNMERVFKAADIEATFGAGSTIAGTSMMHDEMRASGGNFRNSYNSGDVMWAMSLSWPRTVGGMLDSEGYLPGERARELLAMIEARPLTKERLGQQYFDHIAHGAEQHPITGWLFQSLGGCRQFRQTSTTSSPFCGSAAPS